MLVGMIALYYAAGKGVDSFNILALSGGRWTELTVEMFGTSFSFSKIFFWFMFIGFAIKDILANFFSGIVLLIDTPFQFGDVLRLEDGSLGMLKKIGVRGIYLCPVRP